MGTSVEARVWGSAEKHHNSLITLYMYAIMSYNTILSCISKIAPPFSSTKSKASMERPVPPFIKASKKKQHFFFLRVPPPRRLQALIPAACICKVFWINPEQFFCTTCACDKGSLGIQMGWVPGGIKFLPYWAAVRPAVWRGDWGKPLSLTRLKTPYHNIAPSLSFAAIIPSCR